MPPSLDQPGYGSPAFRRGPYGKLLRSTGEEITHRSFRLVQLLNQERGAFDLEQELADGGFRMVFSELVGMAAGAVLSQVGQQSPSHDKEVLVTLAVKELMQCAVRAIALVGSSTIHPQQ